MGPPRAAFLRRLTHGEDLCRAGVPRSIPEDAATFNAFSNKSSCIGNGRRVLMFSGNSGMEYSTGDGCPVIEDGRVQRGRPTHE